MYGLKDKLISIRVDSEKYAEVKKIFSKQGYCRDTFGNIFDRALDNYIQEHKNK